MSTKKGGRSRGWWIAGLVVLALVAVGWFAGWFQSDTKALVKGARVERGPLTISVLQRGNLAAKDAISVKSEIEGQATILFLVREGTIVKPGDLLVELDASDLLERKVGQDISVQNAEASYMKAKASYDIQESQNQSDIEAAERRLIFAKIDEKKYLGVQESQIPSDIEAAEKRLKVADVAEKKYLEGYLEMLRKAEKEKKYLGGDFEQLRKAANEKIKLAEAELAQSKNTFDWSRSLSERGFLTKTELDRDDLDHQRSQIALEQANRGLELLLNYDDPRRRTELSANLREAERGLERANLQAKSRLVDYESALSTSKSKLDLEKEKLQKYVDQLAKAKIYAKDSGMVVYTRMEGGRMGGGDAMQEGTQVRERQEILTIPKTSGLIVEASIHESVLKRVSVGNRGKIRVDSIPGREFDGVVQFVALLADKNSWWANPNQRLYRTEIGVLDPEPEMRPGMSVSIDILSETISDCLSVPIQAIVLDKGKTTAFVVDGSKFEQRDVKVGRSNDSRVEVVEGLREGEEVLLAPPPGFTPTGVDDAQKGETNGNRPNAMPAQNGMGAPAGMGAPTAGPGSGAGPAGATENAPTAGGGEPGTNGAPREGMGPRRGQSGDGSGRRKRPPSDGNVPKANEGKSGGTPEKQTENGGASGGERD